MGNNPNTSSTPAPTPENLDPLMSKTAMESIIPDELPGKWEYSSNYSEEGSMTMIVSKPGNHIVTITVTDKRTPRQARYSVTPSNFSYSGSNVNWIWSETVFKRAPAMKEVYVVEDTQYGELIAYPHDRYLVVASITGEGDEIVDMQNLLDSLEFTQ